jgi:hypothetical protein
MAGLGRWRCVGSTPVSKATHTPPVYDEQPGIAVCEEREMAEEGIRGAEQLGIWRDDLIDLSRRNRLLNSGSSRSGVMRIIEPSLEEVVNRLGDADRPESASSSWRFHYPPSADMETADPALLAALSAEDPAITEEREEDELLTDVTSALTLSKRLRTLERKAASEFMDFGSFIWVSEFSGGRTVRTSGWKVPSS